MWFLWSRDSYDFYETQLKEQFEVQEELRDDRDKYKTTVSELRERIISKENENKRELKRREKTQKELMDVRTKLDSAEVKEIDFVV